MFDVGDRDCWVIKWPVHFLRFFNPKNMTFTFLWVVAHVFSNTDWHIINYHSLVIVVRTVLLGRPTTRLTVQRVLERLYTTQQQHLLTSYKIACFPSPSLFDAPAQGEPVRISGLNVYHKSYIGIRLLCGESCTNRFRLIHPCDRRTDGQTDRRTGVLSV